MEQKFKQPKVEIMSIYFPTHRFSTEGRITLVCFLLVIAHTSVKLGPCTLVQLFMLRSVLLLEPRLVSWIK